MWQASGSGSYDVCHATGASMAASESWCSDVHTSHLAGELAQSSQGPYEASLAIASGGGVSVHRNGLVVTNVTSQAELGFGGFATWVIAREL